MRSIRPALLLTFLALLAWSPAAFPLSVPNGFAVENMVPGTTFTAPTAITFLPDGSFFVAEKGGRVLLVRNGVTLPTPVIDLTNEVMDLNDRGLLDLAVDPNYAVNHFIYLLYTVDPDTNGVDVETPSFGRLTRYRMNLTGDTNVVAPSTRTILMGTNWTNGPLIATSSHSIGSLRWGRDGSLLVSAGEGANFLFADNGGLYPSAFGPGKTDPYEDIGAYRAQDITSLAGKILRINPLTGHGYASNPYADSNLMSVRSRVYAYGLRNPFRFAVRPGTGSPDTTAGNPGVLCIGDVGWDTYEELNVATAPGRNFGWPCREGMLAQPTYQLVQPTHNGCASVGTSTNPAGFTSPVSAWHHSTQNLSSPPNFVGHASVAGSFYSDTLYPTAYRDRYFFADYTQQWIKFATFDGNTGLLSIQDFGSDMDMPVCIVNHPTDGCLWYVSILTGQIRRIRYLGGGGGSNNPPIAAITASPTAGLVPLNVSFSSAGTYDPDSDSLTYAWAFGDGGSSSQPSPLHTYQVAGAYTASLTVTDGNGGSSLATVGITVGSVSTFPTTTVLDDFNRANGGLGALWVDDAASLVITSNTMRQLGPSATTVWNGLSFGPDQECYIRMDAVTP
ncbi:MAG: PQQ-dependent sugar dehydrogenase, partial [Candidatus Eisenbacteria bacterium]|nr:PQQ-dependent sugar dehydrogenase [Candidatus Eisenbacteria bacterium]